MRNKLINNIIPISLLFELIEIFFQTPVYVVYFSHVVFLCLYIIILNKNILRVFKGPIGCYLIYLAVLITISSFIYEFNGSNIGYWFRIFRVFAAYYIGMYIFNSISGHTNIIDQIFKASIIYIIYMVLIQLIDFNYIKYLSYSGDFNLGSIISRRLLFISFSIIILVFGINIYGILKKKKLLLYIILVLMSVILIMTFRRTAIIVGLLGSLFYLVKSINLFGTIKYIIIASLFITLSLFPIYDIYKAQLEIRQSQFDKSYEDEARFVELLILDTNINNNSLIWLLFGDHNRFVTNSFWKDFAGFEDRSIHSDFVFIIYTSGITGLIIYLLIYYKIIKNMYVLHKRRINNYEKHIVAIFYTFVFMNLILLFPGGGIDNPTHGMISFIIIGASTGYFKKNNK